MSPVYSKNTSYLLCVCKEQGSFSLCVQDYIKIIGLWLTKL